MLLADLFRQYVLRASGGSCGEGLQESLGEQVQRVHPRCWLESDWAPTGQTDGGVPGGKLDVGKKSNSVVSEIVKFGDYNKKSRIRETLNPSTDAEHRTIVNRPGVAGAVLQTPP